MLFDPKWQQETKADPFTLAAFIVWLENRSPETQYSYANCRGGCLIGQYMAKLGIDWYGKGAPYCDFLAKFEAQGIDLQSIAGRAPYTFGAALDRAGALQAKRAG